MKLLEYCNQTGKRVEEFNGNRKYIATGDVNKNTIETWKMVDYNRKPSRANLIAKPKDLLFAKMKDTIKVILVDEKNCEYIYSTGFYCITVNPEINPLYIYHYLNSKKFNLQKDKYCTGATQKALNNDGLKRIEIKEIPKYEKQIKIIEEFNHIEEAIKNREDQIKDIDNYIKALFIEMFGNPIRNTKNMPIKRLEEVCTIYRGASPRPIEKFLNGNVPWIKIGDATDGDNIYIYKTKECITTEGAEKSRLIKKGGLIFANCGVSLGFARILQFDGCIHDGWLAFENFEQELNPIFLLESLNFCTEYFREIAPEGTQPNLNTDIMKNYKQIIPDMREQKIFAEKILKIDKIKSEYIKDIEDLKKLKDIKSELYF